MVPTGVARPPLRSLECPLTTGRPTNAGHAVTDAWQGSHPLTSIEAITSGPNPISPACQATSATRQALLLRRIRLAVGEKRPHGANGAADTLVTAVALIGPNSVSPETGLLRPCSRLRQLRPSMSGLADTLRRLARKVVGQRRSGMDRLTLPAVGLQWRRRRPGPRRRGRFAAVDRSGPRPAPTDLRNVGPAPTRPITVTAPAGLRPPQGLLVARHSPASGALSRRPGLAIKTATRRRLTAETTASLPPYSRRHACATRAHTPTRH